MRSRKRRPHKVYRKREGEEGEGRDERNGERKGERSGGVGERRGEGRD
jgi:hypothetical protein